MVKSTMLETTVIVGRPPWMMGMLVMPGTLNPTVIMIYTEWIVITGTLVILCVRFAFSTFFPPFIFYHHGFLINEKTITL